MAFNRRLQSPNNQWGIVPENMDDIVYKFRGDKSWLSNFAHAPILFDGVHWPTAEHLFQAAKSKRSSDRKRILMTSSPVDAKRLGKMVELRPDWAEVKFGVMLNITRMKFGQSQRLHDRLIETTQTTFIEGNYWHDNEWGMCYCDRCKTKYRKNMLGQIIATVKDELLDDDERFDDDFDMFYKDDQEPPVKKPDPPGFNVTRF